MTERFGPPKATFFDLADLDDFVVGPVAYGGRSFLTEILSAEITKKKNVLDSGRMRLAVTADWKKFLATDQASHSPRIVVLSQTNQTRIANSLSPDREGGAFLVESVRPSHDSSGKQTIDISGLGVMALLKKWKVWRPVGAETIFSTTVATAAAAPAMTTVAVGAPAGNNSVVVASDAGMDVGDELRITMNGDAGIHVTKITALDVGGPNITQYANDLLANADAGNAVETRTAVIHVADATDFQPGMLIEITMDNAAVHRATIVSKTEDDIITIDSGLTAVAAVGKPVKSYDYSLPATDDVTQIIGNAPPWQVQFQTGSGTASGTSHAPRGESVLDLLMDTAQRSNEFFRYELGAGVAPFKRFRWRRSADSSGITLVAPSSQAAINTADSNVNQGIIHRISAETVRNPVTRLYPFGGDGAISLANVSEIGYLKATVEGYVIFLSDDPYQPDYIQYTQGVNNFGVLEETATFGHITLSDKPNLAELQAASDALVHEAIAYISKNQERVVYTVECILHKPLYPGQTVAVQNDRIEPLVSESTLYVQEVTEYLDKGVIRSRLVLTKEPHDLMTTGRALGQQLKATAAALRRGSGGGALTIIGGSGGEGGEHDHLDYLKGDGSRPLTGNLAVNAGVTIDGVDLSAHVANADAHHLRAAASNSGIIVNFDGQLIGVNLNVVGSGLEINSGLKVKPTPVSGLEVLSTGLQLADTLAGAGLTISGKVLNVTLAANSGLSVAADSLALGGPSSISTATGNTVSGATHTHFVNAFSDGINNANQLAKFDTNGKVTLAGAGVGVAADTISALKVQARAIDDISLYIKRLTGQTASMWRVEDTDGSALMLLTGTGDLESGKQGFVSGLTGWQIAANGDAEFNNVFVRGELHASVFVADEMHATGGTMAVLTTAKVAENITAFDNILPAMGLTFPLVLQASYATGLCYFAANQIIRIKFMGAISSGGPLDLYDIYVQVQSVTSNNDRDMANGNPGTHDVVCVRKWGGATGVVIPPGTATVKWGRAGGGVGAYTGGMILTSDLNQSPYLDVFTVDASIGTANTWTAPPMVKPRVRVGNLDGVLGLSEQWGIAMGTDLSSTALDAKYIVASDLQFKLNHVDMSLYRAGERTISLNDDGINVFVEQPFVEDYRAVNFRDASNRIVGYLAGYTDIGGFSDVRGIDMGGRSVFANIPATLGLFATNTGSIRSATFSLAAHTTGTNAILISDYLQVRGGLNVGNVNDSPVAGRIQATDSIMTDGGLTVGNRTSLPGGTGVLRFAERSVGVNQPPSNFADLFLVSVGGIQQLRIRFENGSTATLATAF